MKQENVNKCHSCGNYVEHYVKTAKGFEAVTGCGHCISEHLNRVQSEKIIKRWLDCNYYIPKSEQIESRQEGIKEAIYSISKYLREISAILTLDNN